jgi:hypothetical protein
MTTRRHFLRAAGIAIGLPHLRSLARSDDPAPQRIAFIYTPNGYLQRALMPAKVARGSQPLTLTPSLEPLALIKDRVALITGLDRRFVPGTGVHAQCGSCWLSSSAPQDTQDGGFPTNITLDQLIARSIGTDTALPSLELSCNDHADNKETKYYESISWYGPGYAANTEKNPRAVFQRMFGQGNAGPTRSILDSVLSDARSMQRRLGRDDQAKLAEYLDSVRATEQRIQRAETAARRIGKPPLPEPEGIPEKRGDYLRLMADLVVHAFQHDLTRVATIVIDPERWDSPRMFHDLFDAPQNHHVLTHTAGEEAKAKLARIDHFHMQFYAHVAQRLQQSGLHESTTLLMGSGISDGDRHDYTDLQVLVTGGGSVKPGHHHFEGKRPLADLWLTLAHQHGVQAERFADSTGVLKEVMG